MDETYIAVRGKWAYLYCAIDSAGQLVDPLLSEHRDVAAAKAFFKSPRGGWTEAETGHHRRAHTLPHGRSRRLGKRAEHRIISCLGNLIEQDHRDNQRYYPMLAFEALATAAGFCRVREEARSYLRPRQIGHSYHNIVVEALLFENRSCESSCSS